MKSVRSSALIFHEWNQSSFNLYIYVHHQQKNTIEMKNNLRNDAELIFTKINTMFYHDMKKTWHNR